MDVLGMGRAPRLPVDGHDHGSELRLPAALRPAAEARRLDEVLSHWHLGGRIPLPPKAFFIFGSRARLRPPEERENRPVREAYSSLARCIASAMLIQRCVQ